MSMDALTTRLPRVAQQMLPLGPTEGSKNRVMATDPAER